MDQGAGGWAAVLVAVSFAASCAPGNERQAVPESGIELSLLTPTSVEGLVASPALAPRNAIW
jgi:hypothetical protein